MSAAVAIRPATGADGPAIWRWRNDPATRAASLDTRPIPLEAHLRWFDTALASPDRAFFIGLADGDPVGFVRLDRDAATATVSVALAPEARGRGISVPLLAAAMAACPWPVRRFTAVIRPENAASKATFERAGFHLKVGGDPLVMEKENVARPLIVVLAHELDASGTPDDQSRARLALAAEAMSRTPQARLVTSGWPYARDPARSIARMMADAAARDFGVDPARILSSPRARDTVGDAVFLRSDILGDGPLPESVTVVTSAYHAARAQAVFDFVLAGDPATRVAATNEPTTADQSAREATSLAAFRRTFGGIAPGDLPAITARLWRDHPLYNGTIYGPDSPGVLRPGPSSL